jgi:DHA3 family tetracycline resistance protein-like MFS transporter
MSLPAGSAGPTAVTGRFGVLRPLRNRDFAMLWCGHTISLLGDGVYLVTVAWQAYELSNTPTALSLVGAAWTLPTVLLLIPGGVLSDRFDKRLLMVGADVLRTVAIGAVAILSLTGALELWMLLVLVGVYGVGDALFLPSATAITPLLVPKEQLVEANALEYLVRPLALRFAGPALGGLLVATVGPGLGFAVDAATFAISAAFILAIRPRPGPPREPHTTRSAVSEVRAGLAYVRAEPWLWATLAAASLTVFAFFGPLQVLLPFHLKSELGFGPGTFGAVLAASGLGSIAAALAIGQWGLPRRVITWMYIGWALAPLEIAFFAFTQAAWQFMAVAFAGGALNTLGNVAWGTLIRTRVPSHLLGRVASVDWQLSIALTPLSFALAGPIAEAVGTETTMLAAGLLGAVAGIAFLFVPGVRDPEREAVQASAVPDQG